MQSQPLNTYPYHINSREDFERALNKTHDALARQLRHTNNIEGEIIPYSGPQCYEDRDKSNLIDYNPHFKVKPPFAENGELCTFCKTPTPSAVLATPLHTDVPTRFGKNQDDADKWYSQTNFIAFADKHNIPFFGWNYRLRDILFAVNTSHEQQLTLPLQTNDDLIQEVCSKMGFCNPPGLPIALPPQKWYSWLRFKLFAKDYGHTIQEVLASESTFVQILYAVNRYYEINPACRKQEGLHEYKGPQTYEDRTKEVLMHYFGNGFYKWYTKSEFAVQLCSMFSKGADVNVALLEMYWHKPFTSRVQANVFEHLLRMTDDALQHYISHGDTEGEIVPYSGPQCHEDRDKRELMNYDPLMHYNSRLISNPPAIGNCPKFQTTPPPPQPLNVTRGCFWCENKPSKDYKYKLDNMENIDRLRSQFK